MLIHVEFCGRRKHWERANLNDCRLFALRKVNNAILHLENGGVAGHNPTPSPTSHEIAERVKPIKLSGCLSLDLLIQIIRERQFEPAVRPGPSCVAING